MMRGGLEQNPASRNALHERFEMRHATWITCTIATLLLVAAEARADPAVEADAETSRPRFDAAASARQGMMLPSLVAANTDLTTRATATSWAGYDAARSSFVLRTFADATLYGRLAIRAGVSYLPDSAHTSATAQPSIGARLQLLREAKHGVDLGIGAFYRMDRFTHEEGLIQALLTASVHLGRTALFGNLAYGQDAEGDDQEGEAMFALLHSLSESLQLGFESRARFKLASSDQKPRAVPLSTVDASVAPTLSYALGPIALLAQAGVSTVRTTSWRAGALAMAGLASSF